MYPSVKVKIDDMIQRTIDVGQKLPENHWCKPGFLNSIQTILPKSDTQTSSQPQSSNQPSDDFVIDHLTDHYKGELPGYVPNSKKASRIASKKVILENP